MVGTLSRKLTVEKEAGYIPGIKIARGVDPINHALFANDSLLLGGASLNIARAFNEILQKFCLISGALINNNKSVVYCWNVDHSEILRIAQTLGFPGFDKWEKIKYLGLPLTLGPSPPSLWFKVIAKIKAKKISWGGQWLTKAGKLILIKVVLSALPIIQSSLLLAPKSITSQISKLLQDFIWNGGKCSQSKMHLVSWDILKRPLSEGGLQIRDPGLANLAMGGKLIWKLFVDKKHPVSKIFWMKYLKGGSLRNLKA